MPQGKVKIFLVVFFLLNAHFQAASGETYHVDINGSADFTTIQAALDEANDFDEIEVWPGTYIETIDFNSKSVRLYSSGGPEVTTIDANGGYHAVQCVNGEDANTILEGLTITGGNANGSGNDACGGGMFNDGSRATVKNCTFSGNSASSGGGMYNSGSSATVSNCRFSGNTSGYMGGGMYNFGGGITVTGCTFTGNEAIELGGGMSNYGGSPKVTDCEFSGNKAGSDMSYGFGGGMYNNSTLTLVNCTFNGNIAERSPYVTGGGLGGGMYNAASDVNIRDCTFSVNHAEEGGGMYNSASDGNIRECRFSVNYAEEGGGMYNSGSSPTISGCIFIGNLCTQFSGAAGMQNVSSSPTVVNCTFSGNTGIIGCSPDAGAMLNQTSSTPTVTGCTFIGNKGFYVGGIYNDSSNSTVTGCTFSANAGKTFLAGAIDGGNPVLTNCIVWGNTPKQLGTGAAVSYSDVEGGWAGTGNIDADPCFVDADGGDLHLSYDSPCIDGGDPNYVPGPNETDLDGYQRIIDGDCNETAVVDMGAYEFNYAYMGDLDYNCGVDFFDFSVFSQAWMTKEGDPDWDWACDMSDPHDDYIDLNDLLILCNNWLAVMP